MTAKPQLIDLEAERVRRDPGFAPLPFTARIEAIVKHCAEQPTLAIVVAGTGCGKTYSLRRAGSEVTELVLVTLNPATGSQRGGLYHIREALAEHPAYRPHLVSRCAYTQATFFPLREIAATFDRSGEALACPVLALDEAQYASHGLLDCCRALYDGGHCSLILAGNDKFNLKGLAPLLSRATYEIRAVTADGADIDAFLNHRKIAEPKARKLLHQVAALRGIRGVAKVLRLAARAGGEPTAATLRAAVRTMRFLDAG